MTDFKTIEERLAAYLDGEMTPEERATFEDEMEQDPSLAERAASWGQTDDLLQSLVPTPSETHVQSLMAANQPSEPRWAKRHIAAALMMFIVGGAGGYGLNVASTRDPQILVVQATIDAADAHRLFTAEVRHAVEVRADETEHLQTWLTKRMGREMTVPQLEDHGFNFVGGRMLPFEGKAAAQYMYETTEGERLTLFMARTEDEAQTSFRFLESDDLNTIRWQEGPWVFVVVAPVEREKLSPIATKMHDTLI
ncbi:MAG: anti-sigma factor [Cognatishimia sp.]|uniref:anti-sigma factor family protein n=1 Tax=Cognatishimia sp. TaxID=2211648 RepID=UPI003B8BE990